MVETGFVVRPARDSDGPAIGALTRRLMPGPGPGRDLAAYAAFFARAPDPAEGAVSVVAAGPDDAPVGFLMIRPETEHLTGVDRAYIKRLAVDPDVEGGGVARLLMGWARGWARERGYASIALDVFATNDRARRFYARSGFEEDFVRMVAPLD